MREGFDGRRHMRRRQPIVAMATFGFDGKQAALQELSEVVARRLWGYPCGIRKRAGGLGASVAQGG